MDWYSEQWLTIRAEIAHFPSIALKSTDTEIIGKPYLPAHKTWQRVNSGKFSLDKPSVADFYFVPRK